MKKIRLLVLLTFGLFANLVVAQNLQVSGVVSDQAGLPVIGAVVTVQGTLKAVATDVDGVYHLSNVADTATLEFRYVGMATLFESLNGRNKVDVTMEYDALQADAVVVTALGLKKQTKSLGYAVQEVDGENLLEKRTVNITNSLSGQVAGLQIVSGGSGPGASSKIILRGQTSLTGSNQPLIVVDGVPMDNFSGGEADFYGNNGMDMGSGLNDLNPEDIEAMTVLKGGSAAALYGSRAANGVILVTTKSGRANEGLGITVSAGISIETLLTTPDLQNSFAQGLNGSYDNTSRNSWGDAVGATHDVWNKSLNAFAPGTTKTYDNVGNFFNPGVINTQSVSFQQQVGKTSVYASINHMGDDSMIPETTLDRTSITARATTNLGNDDRWKVDFKINYVNSKAQNRPTQGANNNNAFYTLNVMPRSLNILDFNPATTADGTQIWWDTQNNPQNNPYWTLQNAVNNDERNRYIGFLSVGYEFTDWLRAELKGGMDSYSTFSTLKQNAGGLAGRENGYYLEGSENFSEINYSALLVAQKDELFGKFGGAVTLGANLMNQSRNSYSATSGELRVPNVFSLNNGIEKPTINSNIINRKMNSVYGSLTVNWDNAIFLDASLRNDWSSTMSKENMSYMYPSVSTSVVLSELIDNMPSWVNFAKVRGSFAQVGNDLDPYQLYTTYGISIDQLGGTSAERSNILFNSDVRSELVSTWEAGVELRLFDYRLRVDAAWYKSNATNQLLTLPTDPASGYEYKMINAGNIQNQGIELAVSASIFRNPEGFNWDATVNFTRNRNTIKELYVDPTDPSNNVNFYSIVPPGNLDGEIYVTAATGSDYGSLYASTVKRVTDKDSEYYGQLILDSNGLPQKVASGLDAENYIGSQQPKFLLGFNNSFSYKGVNLDLNIDARVGGKVYSYTMYSIITNGNSAITAPNGVREKFVVDGVVDDGNGNYTKNSTEITPQDYYYSGLGQNNMGIAEEFFYDATSVRLRTLSLGYTLPKRILENTSVQKVKFSLTANNLWLIYSGIPGLDPEAVSATGSNATGIELGVPPSTRTFTFNVTLNF